MRNIIVKLLLVLSCIITLKETAFSEVIRIFVGASLTEAVTSISKVYEKQNPGVSFQRNFASSGVLAKQIRNGAPCDIYFSANVDWMEYLKRTKHVSGKNVYIMAFNELVFVGKPNLKVNRLRDIVVLGKIAIGSPGSVPAGQYAMDAIRRAGMVKKLERKLVMARDVRECLMYAERDEVDGAFVYKTDAEIMANKVRILFTVPGRLYPRVKYPVALTVAGSRKPEAVTFHTFLKSPRAKRILADYGYAVK